MALPGSDGTGANSAHLRVKTKRQNRMTIEKQCVIKAVYKNMIINER